MLEEDILFEVGDLVKMDNQFSPERHPPMGTYGLVTRVENWHDECHDSNSDSDELVDIGQFINVCWAHHLNFNDQCYTEASLKLVARA
jgi:hypothetical protein